MSGYKKVGHKRRQIQMILNDTHLENGIHAI
jgi:hypothetical protein